MFSRFSLAVSLFVVAVFSWYYFIARSFPLSLGMVNGVVAFSAVIIIGISFLLGPMARFVKALDGFVEYRKDFGLIGYSLAALHILLVVPLLLSEDMGKIGLGDVVSIGVAAVAFTIFTLMALTSTQKWMNTLGYENWKNLQRTGYIAIVLVAAHIALLEKGVFLTRATGQVAIGFVLLILLLRGIVIVFRKREPQKVSLW